jgi:hypothetical protein
MAQALLYTRFFDSLACRTSTLAEVIRYGLQIVGGSAARIREQFGKVVTQTHVLGGAGSLTQSRFSQHMLVVVACRTLKNLSRPGRIPSRS